MKSKPKVAASRRKKRTTKVVRSAIESGEITRIKESAARNELVIVAGTGTSIALTNAEIPALSWKGLITDGFVYAKTKGLVTPAQVKSWKPHLDSPDIDELLGAAEFIGRKLSAPHGDLYARWLEKTFKGVTATNSAMAAAVRGLHASGIPICTLNYDHLLESVTNLQPITLDDSKKTTAWMRRETAGILHLHGSWDSPATCILGIRDYATTLGDDVRDLIQRSLGAFKRLLFVGCGDTFADPNFSALILWLRDKMKTAAPQHYALVANGEVANRNADPAWRGFVEPIGYGDQHRDLPVYLKTHLCSGDSSHKRGQKKSAKPGSKDTGLLERYRAFLVKDCGQMTIEGVRADMEIGQRRFDLERLFVPLKVLQTPPEFPKNDPLAEKKMRKWMKKHGNPAPFGSVFGKAKRIALLALPGGGKTLLLKRLAVAYANSERRKLSGDLLPDINITPVLIRCREWREYIRKPILTLLESIPEITGQLDLAGLRDALLPVLKGGRVLLLVDGLDEIHEDASRTTFVEHLESFLDEYPSNRLVVTSREAGFNLVAPCLSRFCSRWRVAPLEDSSIKLLCDHWRSLMTGDSPGAVAEMNEVFEYLIRNSSLKRLAENPLLLTMLLVVKHGAGRLPPDRVSLYSRAVEVLLDTWNIKGHEPLNLKESIPQLACVAFQLLEEGKQTATEKELLKLLEEARDELPHIRRYAKGSPYDFLKRVELRSSLLLEAGHQVESGATVPFYQFRHLTFQEYLAAVAVAEGHYLNYKSDDTILTPLSRCLISEEWKEVVPMAAVLARKQAEPVIVELVQQAQGLRKRLENGEKIPGSSEGEYPFKLSPPVSRLVQCLVEEAEAAPETITQALQVVAFFAKGCYSAEDWRALARGPYGPELLHHSWLLFSQLTKETEDARGTCTAIAAAAWNYDLTKQNDLDPNLQRLLSSENQEEIGRGLSIIAGTIFVRRSHRSHSDRRGHRLPAVLIEEIEKHIGSSSPPIVGAAIWAWAIVLYHVEVQGQPSAATLDQVLAIWLGNGNVVLRETASTVLSTQLGLDRKKWTPSLTDAEIEKVKAAAEKDPGDKPGFELGAPLFVAFHSRAVWSDEELWVKLKKVEEHFRMLRDEHSSPVTTMLKQLDRKVANTGQRMAKKG